MKISQTFITGTILVGAGAYNTYVDYANSAPEQKKRTLTRNITALGAAALAVVSMDSFMATKFSSEAIQNFSYKMSNSIVKNKFVRGIFAKLMPKKELQPVKLKPLADMIANCTKDVSLTASAAVAGIGAGLLVDRILFLSRKADKQEQVQLEQTNQKNTSKRVFPKQVHELIDNPVVTKVANDNTKNLIMNTTKVFEAAGFISNPFEMPSTILSGVDMAKEKNLQKIVEQTSSGIVAEALIPTFFISITNSLTANKNNWIKLPALALSFFVGDKVGEKVGKILTHEIRDEIFDIDEEEENGVNNSQENSANNTVQKTSSENAENEENEEENDD